MTKTETVTIRITSAEKALIKALAADEDMTVSKWLYKKLIKIINTEE